MKVRDHSGVKSALMTAAFRTVEVSDRRGLAQRVRQEIATLRRLHEDPAAPVRRPVRHGRIATNSSIRHQRP